MLLGGEDVHQGETGQVTDQRGSVKLTPSLMQPSPREWGEESQGKDEQ